MLDPPPEEQSWDDRTPEQKAAYEERVASAQSDKIPF